MGSCGGGRCFSPYLSGPCGAVRFCGSGCVDGTLSLAIPSQGLARLSENGHLGERPAVKWG